MARNYDGENSASVRKELEQEKQQQAAMYKKIELGIIIGAFALAGISVVANIGKCVKYTGLRAEHQAAKVEAETLLEELNAKLQDPTAQNYEYKDPTVGNMAETGQAIALLQNQMILSQQLYNNMNVAGIPQTNTQTVSDTGFDTVPEEDHAVSTAQTGGGAITLDPSDLAPTGTDVPDTETVENTEGVEINSEESSVIPDVNSEYEFTPVTDFNGSLTNDTQTGIPGSANTGSGMTNMDQAILQNTTGQDLAQLIQNFKKNYWAQPIKSVDGNDVLWSWYGNWEFSGTYDYSVNEVPDMKAVWICYDTSDTSHLRPLAFVKANYSESSKKFTNFEAVYTQSYVKKADSQASKWGNPSDAQPGSTGMNQNGNGSSDSISNNSVSLSPDGSSANGEGSENEYRPNITEDDVDTNGSVTLEPDDQDGTTSNSSGFSNSNTGNNSQSNKQPSNPSGSAFWSPGSGAGSGGTTSGGESGSWNPQGDTGNTGTWNSGSSGKSGGSGGSGTWSPAN